MCHRSPSAKWMALRQTFRPPGLYRIPRPTIYRSLSLQPCPAMSSLLPKLISLQASHSCIPRSPWPMVSLRLPRRRTNSGNRNCGASGSARRRRRPQSLLLGPFVATSPRSRWRPPLILEAGESRVQSPVADIPVHCDYDSDDSDSDSASVYSQTSGSNT